MLNWVKSIALGALALLVYGLFQAVFGATTLLPPGEQCFQTGAGPVSSGSVYMLIPNTTQPKDTWQDSGATILNTNPIQLDANGCAIIYGQGSYRQQVYTGPVVGGLPSGNLIYDLPTADTSSFQNVFWAGLASGTADNILVNDQGFNSTDGSVINFIVLSNNLTNGTTLQTTGSGSAALITIPSAAGTTSITPGCLVATNVASVVWSTVQNAWILLTPCAPSSSVAAAIPEPGGYLTLLQDGNQIIETSDISAATTVYYWAYTSNIVPIWNGSAFVNYSFNIGISLNLTGSQLASTIYDVCVFINSGAPTLAVGPAWSNSAAGAGSRGTGGGSAQIVRVQGIWVNSFQITGANGANTYTIPANQCTYVGSILIDGTPGQVSSNVSWGQSRKWGVWNAYHRQQIQLQAGDNTAGGWTYNTATFRASNNSAANSLTVFSGLAEESYFLSFEQGVVANFANSNTLQLGIGVNSTSLPGPIASVAGTTSTATQTLGVTELSVPALGIQTITSLEKGSSLSSNNFFGTATWMNLIARWRG